MPCVIGAAGTARCRPLGPALIPRAMHMSPPLGLKAEPPATASVLASRVFWALIDGIPLLPIGGRPRSRAGTRRQLNDASYKAVKQ